MTGVNEPTSGRFKSAIRGRSGTKLLLRFVAVLATAPAIGWLMGRTLIPGHPIHDTTKQFLGDLTGLSEGDAIVLAGVFLFAVFLGLLLLLLMDIKKRVQAMLFLIGSIVGVGALLATGGIAQQVDLFTGKNFYAGIIGFLLGVSVGLPELRKMDLQESTFQRPSTKHGRVLEFRKVTRISIVVVTFVVLALLLDALTTGVIHPADPVAAVVFLIMSDQFIKYDSEGSYIILGPGRSGKSMMMLGLCLELMQNSETRPNPNEYLMNGLERASNLRPDDEEWPIPSTPHDQLQIASFEVISGTFFPRRLQLTALDYAGQHLGRVADLFAQGQADADRNTIPQQVADWIIDADTMLVVLDIERLVYPDRFREDSVSQQKGISWGLEYYDTILDATIYDDAILVATKCDILIDQGRVASPTEFHSFDAFAEQLTDALASRPDVQQLLERTNEDLIHPVYFETETENGEYFPRLDDHGNLVPVGYNELIAEISARQ